MSANALDVVTKIPQRAFGVAIAAIAMTVMTWTAPMATAMQNAPPPPPNAPQEDGRPENRNRGQDRQDGQRGGMRGFFGGGPRGGPGAGMMRRLGDSFRPEFARRDVPMIRERLALDASQATLVETLLADYEESFGPESKRVQDELQSTMREVATSFFTPEMRERMNEVSQRLRADLEQLAAEGGGNLDQEVRRQIVRERMASIEAEIAKEREQAGAGQETRERIGRMIDELEKWHTERARLRDDLLNGIRVTLSEAQTEKWAAFERFVRRERTIPLGVLSGEQVNLFLVVDEAELSPEAVATLTPILDRYETEVDAALKARNEFLDRSEMRLLRAAQASNTREVDDLLRRSVELHKAVRDINDRYTLEILAALPEADRGKVKERALEAGYERVHRPTQAERSFEAALAMTDLTVEAREAITVLERQFESDVGTLNERIVAQIRKQEPQEVVDEASRVVAMVNGMPPMGAFGRRFGGGDTTPDATQEMFSKRGELSDAYVRRLRGLLTEDQQAQLPQRGGRGGRFGGGEGGPGGAFGNGRISEMPEQIRERVRRYDTNNDGVLDDTEREAAMQGMRQEWRAGRGGDATQ